jgi:phosphoribosyl 1,2-cyclic phosphodiesterase
MKLTVFGSSSSGNGYALEFNNGKLLLLEVGVPIEKYLSVFPNRWGDLIGCLLSHEHKDHVRFIRSYAEFGMKFYATQGTLEETRLKEKSHQRVITNGQPFTLAEQISVLPFKIIHNAKDPSGYLIIDKETDESLLFITDSAYLDYRFTGVDYIMVECNYIDEIADQNKVKGNITGSQFHMSLKTCKEFLSHCDTLKTKKIILIHLSDKNSDEQKMIFEINKITGVETVAALPGDVYELSNRPF